MIHFSHAVHLIIVDLSDSSMIVDSWLTKFMFAGSRNLWDAFVARWDDQGRESEL